MMRIVPVAIVLVAVAGHAAWAQGQPAIRRVAPKAFPLAASPSFGLGFGGKRATALDPTLCGTTACVQYGLGSGWQAGLNLQAPIGRTFGVEIGGAVGRQSRTSCVRGACDSPDKLWAVRGTAMILWRFKARAPVFFGIGGAIARYTKNPVFLADSSTTEIGGSGVVGVDLSLASQVGARIAWRTYLFQPKGSGLPADFVANNLAWDNQFTIGARILFRRP